MNSFQHSRRRSARETFSECRYRWQQVYQHGRELELPPMRRGSAFHFARQLYISALWQHKVTHDHELAADAIRQAGVEYALPQAEWLDLQELWRRWTERFELPLHEFYSVEQPEQNVFDTIVRYDLVTVPDVNTLRITDAKTHWRIVPDAELQKAFQTGFYLAAARKIFPGFRNYEIVYEWVRYGVESSPICYDSGELDDMERRIAEIDEAMDIAATVESYFATAGAHCATCHLVCPLQVQTRVQDDDQAQLVGAMLFLLKRQVAEATNALSAWSAEHGPVRVNGGTYAYETQERRTYDAAEVLDVLRFANIPFTIRTSESSIKPLLTAKKYAAVAQLIKSKAKTTVRTIFGCTTSDEEAIHEHEADPASS